MKLLWPCMRAVGALWRVGLLRLWPWQALLVCLAWWRCRGSLALLAEVAAIRAGTRLALVDDDGPLTFAELHERYQALTGELIAQHGAGPGRQIAILGRNHRSFVVALLAATRTGADVLLMNPDSPPSVLAKLFAGQEAVATIVLHATDLDVAAFAPSARRIAMDGDLGNTRHTKRLPRLARPGRISVLTAGSTGLPKRVGRMPTLANVLPFVLGLLDRLPITLHRPTVLAVPCFHGHGLATLATALAFASPVHLARRHEIAPLLATSQPSEESGLLPVVVSVPTLLGRWLSTGPRNDEVAAVVSGSAPLSPQLCRRLLGVLGPVVYNLYGLSEAGVVSLATPAMLAEAPGTVGRPFPGTQVRILDAAGRESAAEQVGRIHVRGPLVMHPGADGWLCTGDLGRLDQAGRLHICGRADGMFVSGGENVYPQVVEACLTEHAAVADAAIVAVPDAEFGTRMRAFIVLHAKARLNPEDLRTWLRQRLDRHQVPKTIELVDHLPRNLLGKIDRPALAELAQRGTESRGPA